jgi:predicted NBD/HSP70 family sugar kinase
MSINGLTQIRNRNIMSIFNEIVRSDGILRSEISNRTGISLMTIGKIMDQFLKRNIVYEREYMTSSAGRKPALAFLNLNKWRICVFSMTDHVDVSILGLDLKAVYTSRVPVKNNDWGKSLDDAIILVQNYFNSNKNTVDDIVGIGVAVPAPYDEEKDRVVCPNRPNIESLRIRKTLEKNFNTKIVIGEDVKYAGMSMTEVYPEAKESSLYYMYIGAGVGGALINRGEIYRGIDNYAGDIGQLKLGDNQTIESLIASPILKAQLAAVGVCIDAPSLPLDWDTNADIIRLINNYAKVTALAAYNAACMFSPEVIVIDGTYHPLGEQFYQTFNKFYDSHFEPYERQKPKVHFSFGGTDYAVMGVSSLIRKEWLLQR